MSNNLESITPENSSDKTPDNNELFVVGIGASAGGLKALEELFDSMSSDSGAAFVVIQHLSPDFKSLMKELLERHTKMKVFRVAQDMKLVANSVYLIPPGKSLVIEEDSLKLEDRKKNQHDKYEFDFPIDLFFSSLAKYYGERSIGVILSGTGSDGTNGLKAIDEVGGLTLVQDPETAEFDGMPKSAISAEVVNQVLPVKQLAELICQCITNSSALNLEDDGMENNNLITYSNVKQITRFLLESEGIDFSYYKITTLSRRVHRRRIINHFHSITEYINFLRYTKEERKTLSSDLLINVTKFFRDASAWEIIETKILPELIEKVEPHEELRFWIAGCSTGEEAYSLAILVHEALENTEKLLTVKIFATDIDRIALEKASIGYYPLSIARDIDPERLQKYFIVHDNGYQVMRKLREMLIFSPHNLTKDAGFTKLHMVSCRNVLIYLQSRLQEHVLRNFHFSLKVPGVLFLGEAETTGIFDSEFKTLEKKWKIYEKLRNVRLTLPHKNITRTSSEYLLSQTKPQRLPEKHSVKENSLLKLLKENNAVILLVNRNNRLLHVYGDSSKIFLPPQGEIANEVTKLVVVPLQLPLNTAIHRARKEKKTIVYTGIKSEDSEHFFNLNLKVIPPVAIEDEEDCFLVEIKQEQISTPVEIKDGEKFQINDEAQRRILELEGDLQHTRENLQALIEELETTNEEQQASNEELTSSNEELQSTNEELHSVNEELHTVNSEYQSKIQELIQLNNDIDNLLHSTDIGVIFLDADLKIRKSTPAVGEIIALRQSDIERPIQDFSLKVECPDLMSLLAKVIVEHQSVEIEVKHSEYEHYYLMRLHPYQTEDCQNDGVVISFIKIDELKTVQNQLEMSLTDKNRQLAAIETASDGIAVLNDDRFIYMNQAHLDIFGYSHPEDLIGKSWRKLYDEAELSRFETEILPILLEQGKWQGITKAKHRDGHLFDEEITLTFTKVGDLICICRDVSEIIQARQKLLESNLKLEQRVAERTQVLATFSDRLKQLHRLATSSYPDLAALFADYIQTGCQMLGMSTGIISEVKGYDYKVVGVESPLEIGVGSKFDYKDTYCSEVVNSLTTITFGRVGAVEWMQNHPVYLKHKLESYIGTPILVNGEFYGTLNFADTNPREIPFSQEEQEIIELMAKDIGHSIGAVQSQVVVKNNEKLYRSTFEQSAMGIAHFSTAGGFTKVNPRFCQIMGYDEAELLQKKFIDITHPEDLAPDLEYVQQMLSGEINSYTREKRYLRHDGTIVWANLTVTLVREDSGESGFFVAIVEDISDRKQTEMALLESKQSKEQLQLLNEAKDSFIAHMNHELRTPLNSIIGFSSILQQDSQLIPQQLNTVNIINQSGQHLLILINDILDFSKITAKKLALENVYFDLKQFLTDVATVFRLRSQQQGLEFYEKISSDLPTVVQGDATRLRQVLYNLLSNAIKFTQAGSVTLIVEPKRDLDVTQIDLNPVNTHLIHFQVEDTGRGILEEQTTAIFAPFGQLQGEPGNHEGTGLGLTISQELVQLMNSQIELESQVDRGSKFYFDLPLTEVSAELLTTQPKTNCQSGQTLKVARRILVVDDNYLNRTLLLKYLESLGFTVTEACNGKEGLEIAKTFQPDAILLDLVMPIMDGKEMAARIRQQPEFQEIVMIMISANSKLMQQQSEIDCQEFLTKPVDLSQLLELLNVHLELDWERQESTPGNKSPSDLVMPPETELVELRKLAKFGDISAIEAQAEYLRSLDERYIPFVQEVIDLVTSCQKSELKDLLAKRNE